MTIESEMHNAFWKQNGTKYLICVPNINLYREMPYDPRLFQLHFGIHMRYTSDLLMFHQNSPCSQSILRQRCKQLSCITTTVLAHTLFYFALPLSIDEHCEAPWQPVNQPSTSKTIHFRLILKHF